MIPLPGPRADSGGPPQLFPAAVVQQGTTPEQRVVTGTLADLAARVEAAGLRSPCLTIVGEVVRLRAMVKVIQNATRNVRIDNVYVYRKAFDKPEKRMRGVAKVVPGNVWIRP